MVIFLYNLYIFCVYIMYTFLFGYNTCGLSSDHIINRLQSTERKYRYTCYWFLRLILKFNPCSQFSGIEEIARLLSD